MAAAALMRSPHLALAYTQKRTAQKFCPKCCPLISNHEGGEARSQSLEKLGLFDGLRRPPLCIERSFTSGTRRQKVMAYVYPLRRNRRSHLPLCAHKSVHVCLAPRKRYANFFSVITHLHDCQSSLAQSRGLLLKRYRPTSEVHRLP